MNINDLIKVPREATVGGAPIDAFQMDAFRKNDVLIERFLQAVLASPLIPNGSDGDVTNPDAHQFVSANNILVDTTIPMVQGVPLIWMAQEEIMIGNSGFINGYGKGAAPGQDGDFGGSGGGSAAKGGDCLIPISGYKFATGGPPGTNNGNHLSSEWASRVLSTLGVCKGGAGGGNAGASNPGGKGGGIVVLCAPSIRIIGNGKIDVRGEVGYANAGGGGGGTVILVAHTLDNIHKTATPGTQNVFSEGGISTSAAAPATLPTVAPSPMPAVGSTTGGAGGNGIILEREFH